MHCRLEAIKPLYKSTTSMRSRVMPRFLFRLEDRSLVDSGRWTDCDGAVSYIEDHDITRIDYHVASHYHAGAV